MVKALWFLTLAAATPLALAQSPAGPMPATAAASAASDPPPNATGAISPSSGATIVVQMRAFSVTLGEVTALGIDARQGMTSMLALPGQPPPAQAAGHVLRADHPWFEALRAVEAAGLVQPCAHPTLTAVDGQPAEIRIGRTVEIPAPTADNKQATRSETLGFQAWFQGRVTAPQTVHCDVRFRCCELPEDHRAAGGVPALQVREVRSRAQVRSGETLVLAGMKAGIKVKSGLLRQRDDQNELVVLVTTKVIEPGAAAPGGPLR